jgi:hypothetical protein
MTRRAILSAVAALAALTLVLPVVARAAGEECELEPRTACFGVESVEASLSTTQAGAHPDLTLSFGIAKDPETTPNLFGLKDAYAATRNVRVELPPGLIGDPNVLGTPQQCTTAELLTFTDQEGGCPNGSQVGLVKVVAYDLNSEITEPLFMMAPPGGDVVARLGLIAGIFPTFIDFKVRSEGDYGITAEISQAPAAARLIASETTTWGVPADPVHDTERCTLNAALFAGCVVSPARPPGSRPLPFMTNPTRCGVPLEVRVSASSWVEPERFDTKSTVFPTITGCDNLPFGPGLTVEPTSHHAAAPTGLDITLRLPASDGVNVLEPAAMRDIRVKLPPGLVSNPSLGDGLATCSAEQVRFGERASAECPDAAKIADTEFEIPVLSRRMRGAIYLREPEPGNPFRVWVVADDLGVHLKLPGQLEVDKETGQIESIVLDAPQAPLREVKLLFKSGFRAPLVNPRDCGTYSTDYEFVPWSGGPPLVGSTQMTIDEGCATGGFAPGLSAGSIDAEAGRHSTFLFTLTREDGEQNPKGLEISLPTGMAATFAGIPRCEGVGAETGACPPGSQIGRVIAAIGAGPTPLWVPQEGKRPTAVYLGGPYKGAPLSIVSVVPRQAGPFDFGDEVVRSAVFVDPVTARATAKADPLPQIIEGIPITYRTIHVELDRPGFSLNPTSCAQKATEATLTSAEGAVAHLTSPFAATDCAKLGFKPKLGLRLFGGTRRGAFPKLRARLVMPAGGANIAGTSVALPRSEFIEQGHFATICTRVQFKADGCPAGSIYGTARALTPLLDEPLEGPVYLRSSDHTLPDVVVTLKGPPSLPIEVELAGRVDSVNGGVRTTFEGVPDAPVSEFILEMQGGKKGLFVNSENLCAKVNRATARFSAQNGRVATLRPKMQVSCKGKGASATAR